MVYPNNGSLELKKNREVNTVGDISVGNFDFKSVDLVFDYDSYLIDLKEIDTLKMLTKKTQEIVIIIYIILVETFL